MAALDENSDLVTDAAALAYALRLGWEVAAGAEADGAAPVARLAWLLPDQTEPGYDLVAILATSFGAVAGSGPS